MVLCQKCGTENPDEASQCHHCAAALPSTAPVPQEFDGTRDSEATDSVVAPQPNFLVKHWRGDYSLGFSYWVIGTLLTVIVVALTRAISSGSGMQELGARASGAFILTIYAVTVPLTLWQLVGIWRSAGKHRQRGGKTFWAVLARIMVVLGLLRAAGALATPGIALISEAARLVVGIDNTPPYQIRVLRDGTELELSGGMPFGTADALKKALDAAPAVHVVHLNSQGGRMGEAYQLYRTIRERNLITYTSAECVSACSVAFLAGRERYLGENGRLGFHSTSVGGELTGEVAKELNDRVRQTLLAHGVPGSFIDRALSTSPKDMWYPSKDELLEAKVIDSVVDSRYFGLSGVSQWRDAHKIESGLLAVPVFAALAQYDQQNYAKLRNILVSGIQNGRAQIDIQNDIRSIFVQQLVPLYLKAAPDEALVRYWRSQINEMKHLANLNPQQCADFAFPQFAKSAPDLQRLLPKDVAKEDLEALAAVVKGVATNRQDAGADPRAQADLQAIMVTLARKSPWALDVLRSPANHKADPAALCGAVIALYSDILEMPSSRQSGAVLRYMASQ